MTRLLERVPQQRYGYQTVFFDLSLARSEMRALTIKRAESAGYRVMGLVTLIRHKLGYESRRYPEFDSECFVATVEVVQVVS